MLSLLLGTDWIANREALLSMIVQDIKEEKPGRIWIVPELVSYDTERRLCMAAGDTSSRFAEVLSFTRLYRRVSDTVGHGARVCLDNGGRVVAMAAAARKLHSKLKAYAAMESRPEFLISLVDAVDEFKRCCISAQDLMEASRFADGAFAQKLEELSLLLETYDGVCQQGKRDPSDQMTWLLEQLEDSTFAQNHVFYIDGFPDFTRQHLAIVEHLSQYSENVIISLNCDCLDTCNPAFETSANTAGKLYRWAKNNGVNVKIQTVGPRDDALAVVRNQLFQGKVGTLDSCNTALTVTRCNSIYDECYFAAERIMDLVQSGVRYKDISVVCADMSAYKNAVSAAFQRCKIPTYLSGTDEILDKSVINTVLSAIDAALGGFERREMIRYLKSMLSPLDLETADEVENYVITWNITRTQWTKPWSYHPGGLGEPWSEKSQRMLESLNRARQRIVEPLNRLRKGFQEAVNVAEQVRVLYLFLEDIRLAERMSVLANQLDASGDYRNAQILDQLWEILLSALEQMHDVLGTTCWDTDNFTRLLKLLLSQYDVGTIPPVLDSVTVGPVSAMRCQQTKHLLVLGALDGSLPGYSGSSGVLTDQERVALRQMGVPLTGGSLDGIQAEFAEIYGAFCGAEETIYVSCPAGQPSFLYRRLLTLAGKEWVPDAVLGAARADAVEAGAYLARFNAEAVASDLGIGDEYAQIHTFGEYALGTIQPENVRKLYGDMLNLSASQVDRLADCRLSYFLKYGLRAKERKTITVDPAEFGTYVHAVLENTARSVMEHGGFHKVSVEETLRIAKEYSQRYAQERFSELDSERLNYLFQRNSQELEQVVQELWQELRESAFIPVDFELAFGGNGQMESISIHGQQMDAQLRGFVDRVDEWKDNSNHYFRVVDYKTGKKDFDYCDVFNGYGLQMLLYLFALEDHGEPILGSCPIPAGVQYFPARVPVLSSDGVLSQEEALSLREKTWKRKGLLLSDEDVLLAMEPDDKPKRMNYTRRKDGSITGDLADRMQLRLLKGYVFCLLGKMVDDIASGCVEPNPYTRGSSHNACTFCPYGAVCRETAAEGRRNYKSMTAQRFWEEIEKEMKKYG